MGLGNFHKVNTLQKGTASLGHQTHALVSGCTVLRQWLGCPPSRKHKEMTCMHNIEQFLPGTINTDIQGTWENMPRCYIR